MTIREVLEKEGISENEALREQAMLVALFRVSRYEVECKRFEDKHGTDLNSLKASNDTKIDAEDIALEDDLMDWEYSDAAVRWWRLRAEELRDAA